ncbi:MAG TPA: AarF/UbiB family protein [Vicinamibacterales bacterium]|nr:AarF/UbiB family protein [Vicinamibacterales bacterium]
MGLSLKLDHLRRYRDIAALLLKYGRSDLVFSTGAELAGDLEEMGPAFVKVGQLLSTRSDLLPPDTLRGLSRLQDAVEPFAYEDVERTVNEELGVRLSKAFSRFDRAPIAAASLGQVHRAALRDGREVAVKVQRPNVREQVLRDMDSLQDLAGFLEHHSDQARRASLLRVVEELRQSVLRELDYRMEAQNMVEIGRNLARFRRIVVPQPVPDYSGARVLTMDYISGQKITAVSPLVLAEAGSRDLAEELFRAYLHQVILDGMFHADPHPGNVLLTDDRRLALIDLGMASRLSPDLQENLLNFLLAVADGRTEQASDLALEMGERLDGFDEPAFRRRIADVIVRSRDSKIGDTPAGTLMLAVAHAAVSCGVRLPNELTLLGKTLLNLDEVGRTLAPDFDVQESLRRNANELMMERMRRSVTPAAAFSSLLEAKSFAERLPGRINRILDAVADQQMKVRVELIDEGAVLDGLQKVANRITLGLILAAMIIGAAMLMRVETSFRILGYPGLAMLFFLGAAVGGSLMVVQILRSDQRS